jgi:uracil-DNA glycosylase
MESEIDSIFKNFNIQNLINDNLVLTNLQTTQSITENKSDESKKSDELDKAFKVPKLIIKSEINNNWSILDIALKQPPVGWVNFFESCGDELKIINNILQKYESSNCISYPYRKNIFKAFNLVKPENIKVIIFDLEPYNSNNLDGVPLATGLALSVNKNCYKIPNNVLNIYRELQIEYPDFKIPNHGNLEKWCESGIFLLNLSLTVKPNSPGSHKDLWTGFVIRVIEYLNSIDKSIPYILLHKDCLKIVNYISGKSTIFKIDNPGFNNSNLFNSNIFKKVNSILEKKDKSVINWNSL